MSYAAYNLLVDALDMRFFRHAFDGWNGDVWGPDHFGMYCAGHEL